MGKGLKIAVIASYFVWVVASIVLASLKIISWGWGLLWLIAIPLAAYIFFVFYCWFTFLVVLNTDHYEEECLHKDVTKLLNDGKPCFGRQMGETSCPCQYFEQKKVEKSKTKGKTKP